MTDIARLYPEPGTQPLAGTYLAHALRERGTPDAPFVYTNFIASLDGRIAQRDAQTGRYGVPRAIANKLDWRLYLELAAQADAVLTSARRLRELATLGRTLRCVADLTARDLAAWRRERGMPTFPACVLVTATLDLPFDAMRMLEHDEITVLSAAEPTPAQRRAMDDVGATLVPIAADRVGGADVVDVARRRGYRTVYSIGGPNVLRMLAVDDSLHRLYLTHAHRLLAGDDYATLLSGDSLLPPVALKLHELYLLAARDDAPQMLFASYDVER